jgi:hypothetical protein
LEKAKGSLAGATGNSKAQMASTRWLRLVQAMLTVFVIGYQIICHSLVAHTI